MASSPTPCPCASERSCWSCCFWIILISREALRLPWVLAERRAWGRGGQLQVPQKSPKRPPSGDCTPLWWGAANRSTSGGTVGTGTPAQGARWVLISWGEAECAEVDSLMLSSRRGSCVPTPGLRSTRRTASILCAPLPAKGTSMFLR